MYTDNINLPQYIPTSILNKDYSSYNKIVSTTMKTIDYFPEFFDGTTARFLIHSDGFLDPYSINIEFQVGLLQKIKAYVDNSAHSFIKEIIITSNGIEIERIKEYDLLNTLFFDLRVGIDERRIRNEGFGCNDASDIHLGGEEEDWNYHQKIHHGSYNIVNEMEKSFSIPLMSFTIGMNVQEYKLIPLHMLPNLEIIIVFDLNGGIYSDVKNLGLIPSGPQIINPQTNNKGSMFSKNFNIGGSQSSATQSIFNQPVVTTKPPVTQPVVTTKPPGTQSVVTTKPPGTQSVVTTKPNPKPQPISKTIFTAGDSGSQKIIKSDLEINPFAKEPVYVQNIPNIEPSVVVDINMEIHDPQPAETAGKYERLKIPIGRSNVVYEIEPYWGVNNYPRITSEGKYGGLTHVTDINVWTTFIRSSISKFIKDNVSAFVSDGNKNYDTWEKVVTQVVNVLDMNNIAFPPNFTDEVKAAVLIGWLYAWGNLGIAAFMVDLKLEKEGYLIKGKMLMGNLKDLNIYNNNKF